MFSELFYTSELLFSIKHYQQQFPKTCPLLSRKIGLIIIHKAERIVDVKHRSKETDNSSLSMDSGPIYLVEPQLQKKKKRLMSNYVSVQAICIQIKLQILFISYFILRKTSSVYYEFNNTLLENCIIIALLSIFALVYITWEYLSQISLQVYPP